MSKRHLHIRLPSFIDSFLMQNPQSKKNPLLSWIPLFALGALLYDRSLLATSFLFRWLDDDQALMWYATTEFSKAKFHEPRFFGQSYNTLIEALAAVPLYLLGVPLSEALPTVTILLSLAPFLAFSAYAYYKKNYLLSTTILFLPLCISAKFDFYSSMPRGFVTGIPFIIPAVLMTFNTFQTLRFRLFIAGFFSILAISINPNTAILSVTVLTYFVISEYKTVKNILKLFAGISSGILLHIIVQSYYFFHPEVVIFKQRALILSEVAFFRNIKSFDFHFGDFTPFFYGSGILTIACLLCIAGIFLSQKAYRYFTALIVTLVVILLSLWVPKVAEGSPDIFLPYARMFLTIPTLMAFCLIWINESSKPLLSSKCLSIISVLLLCIFPMQFIIHTNEIHLIKKKILRERDPKIHFMNENELVSECDKLLILSKENAVDLIVYGEFSWAYMLNYGCSALIPQMPHSLFIPLERRTWMMKEEEIKVESNVLLFGLSDDEVEIISHKAKEVIPLQKTGPSKYLVKFDKAHILPILESAGMNIKKYKLPLNVD